MKGKIKIGNFGPTAILINLICTKIVLNYPRKMAQEAGTAGWILALYISVLVYIIFLILLRLYKPFGGMDILDIGEAAMGKLGKIFVGLVLIMEFGFILSVVLREFAEDMKTISLPKSPISFVTILFCIAIIITAYVGIEAISRIHSLFIPYVIVNFLFIIIAMIPKYNISNIAPWFGLGLDKIALNFKGVSVYSEFAVIFLLAPFLNNKKDLMGVGRNSLIIASFFLVLSTISYMLYFQYPVSAEHFLPMYHMARAITIGRFFARMEAAFIFFWAPVAFAYLSTLLYFIAYIFKKIFGLKYYKPLILPFAILVYTFSLIPEDLIIANELEIKYFRSYAWIGSFLIPFIILLIANLRVRKNNKNLEGEA